ncbi:MAG: type II secretion system minor pseudopilin GspK [Nevskiales bacterium]|nr:type II secretion system minor pseudopilin GspK [Nevskiales bacterium]
MAVQVQLKSVSQGVALVTAILVVAIVSLAATALYTSSHLAIQRTGTLHDTEQAWWFAYGAESWVLGILKDDAEDNDHDSLDEDWAKPVDYLPVDQGSIRGQVIDMQGRFNLNNLALPDAQYKLHADQFERLLQSLPDVDVPQGLATTIRDWMDTDQIPGFPAGAEDNVYLNLIPPYRAANRLFATVSELLAVQGVTPKLFQLLQPLVAALPVTVPTPININTAPEAVLRALSATVDDAKLMSLLRRTRGDEDPYQNIQDVINEGIFGSEVTPQIISVNSAYFQIQSEVVVGSGRVTLYSLVLRPDAGNPTVLGRSVTAD